MKLKMVIASTNAGKIREFQQIFEGTPIELIPQADLDIPEVEETGSTFVENAIIKARHAAKHAGLPAIADDSGLVVDALNGEPGVRSARFAGPDADDQGRISKLLEALEGVGEDDRYASFHCITVLMDSVDDPAPLICEGVWDGRILEEPVGDQGFGYDPIFFDPVEGCSAAEMGPDQKNAVSHRGQALDQLAEALSELSDQNLD